MPGCWTGCWRTSWWRACSSSTTSTRSTSRPGSSAPSTACGRISGRMAATSRSRRSRTTSSGCGMAGSCSGCPSSSVTLTYAIERAILDAAPEIAPVPRTVDVEPAPPLIQLEPRDVGSPGRSPAPPQRAAHGVGHPRRRPGGLAVGAGARRARRPAVPRRRRAVRLSRPLRELPLDARRRASRRHRPHLRDVRVPVRRPAGRSVHRRRRAPSGSLAPPERRRDGPCRHPGRAGLSAMDDRSTRSGTGGLGRFLAPRTAAPGTRRPDPHGAGAASLPPAACSPDPRRALRVLHGAPGRPPRSRGRPGAAPAEVLVPWVLAAVRAGRRGPGPLQGRARRRRP